MWTISSGGVAVARPTELAQRKNKTGSHRPTYRLRIAGENFSPVLYDGSVTYSLDGGSELTLSADHDFAPLVGAQVIVEVGYGDETWPYFGGWLEEADDGHYGGPSSATCYGPFKELGEISLPEDVSYSSFTIGQAIVDLRTRAKRALDGGSTYDIVGNPSFVLSGEEAALGIGTPFGGGLESLLALADWISVDRPGFRTRYRAKPRPRPNGQNEVAVYTEDHYPPEGFKAIPGKMYGSVGAFALDDNGDFKWPPVIVRVDPSSRYKASELKTYWLEDFAGDEKDAWAECGELAKLISGGVFSWTLAGISANPELELFEIMGARTTERRDEGGRFKERYDVRYSAAIDLETQLDISREGNPMSLGGITAVKLWERKLPKPFPVSRGGGAVVRA